MATQSETRIIIPAPSETTSESGIVWYAVDIDRSTLTSQMIGFGRDHVELARLSSHVDDHGLITTVMSDAAHSVTITLSGYTGEAGSIQLEGSVSGHEFHIRGPLAESDAVNAMQLSLTPEDEALLRPWLRLSDSMAALVTALNSPIDLCQGCMMLAGALCLSADMCAAGDAAACSVLFTEWQMWQQACVPPPCH
jgi:hypothetical protein